jgi:hypothetical protein
VQAESWNVEHKAKDSPLTRAYKEDNAVICDGLACIGKRHWEQFDLWLADCFPLHSSRCSTPHTYRVRGESASRLLDAQGDASHTKQHVLMAIGCKLVSAVSHAL